MTLVCPRVSPRHRVHGRRLRPLLLHLQHVESSGATSGGSVRDARIQRWNLNVDQAQRKRHTARTSSFFFCSLCRKWHRQRITEQSGWGEKVAPPVAAGVLAPRDRSWSETELFVFPSGGQDSAVRSSAVVSVGLEHAEPRLLLCQRSSGPDCQRRMAPDTVWRRKPGQLGKGGTKGWTMTSNTGLCVFFLWSHHCRPLFLKIDFIVRTTSFTQGFTIILNDKLFNQMWFYSVVKL